MIPTTTNFKAEALTDTQLRLEAPSIFASGPLTGLSSRYTFVPTTDIVAGLREKQWLPVHVEQQRARVSGRMGFQKHLIRFRRAEQMETLDEWNAELVLTDPCPRILGLGASGKASSEAARRYPVFSSKGLQTQTVFAVSIDRSSGATRTLNPNVVIIMFHSHDLIHRASAR